MILLFFVYKANAEFTRPESHASFVALCAAPQKKRDFLGLRETFC